MEITLFTKCLFEFIGTLVLVLLGDGVVASTVLKQSKGFNGGWAVITIAWGLAVMCGVLIAGPYSGAHLNPAVSVGLAVAGSFPWAFVPGYIAAQLLGGFCGAVLVYVYYKDHFDATDDPATKLGVFCTMPAIMDKPRNLFCEFLGTFLLVFVILAIGNEQNINPARDLPPRVAHSILPIRGKGTSGWGYSWVPVTGPVLGALAAGLIYGCVYMCG